VSVVGLGEIERDQAVGVAGRHLGAPAVEHVEGKPSAAFAAADDRQSEFEQREDEPAFGRLGLREALAALDILVVGARARQRAAEAQPARAGEAVAGRNLAVGARRPVAEALDLPRIPVEAERRLALQALKTLEDHEVAACGTSERAQSNLT